ncbi:class I adenylate-forming enzyme family protein [Actinomadura nitritigenes]|uniref:class I adenylate-forming enzyme family protein n=1 Tax=Actinomadura nitritigenes TaxID=134602 RepID=UPI003D94D7D5
MIGTVAGILEPALRARPDAPALIGPSGMLSYTALDQAADAAAGALWELGVRPGDRVAACLPNDLPIVVAFHATQRLGAIWVGVAEGYPAAEQDQLVALSEPVVVLAGPKWKGGHPGAIDSARWVRLVAAGHRAPVVEVDPFAPAAIAFTSGTTGAPKGIVHSQHNLVVPGAVLVATRGYDHTLRRGDSLAMTILNMLILGTLTTAQAHGCSILIDRRDIGGIAEQVRRHEVTVWNGVPAQIYDLARRPDLDFGSLRELWSGGADTPQELRNTLHDVHGITVHTSYGFTEAPTVVAIDPVDGRSVPRASGVVLPHLDVAAYDAGERLPAGVEGEIVIEAASTGPWAGLWRPPLGEWREGALAPGTGTRVHSGDIGAIDADGWLTVVDRKKLVVVRGGANVYPAEVERVIRLHPDVEATAVFGIPDSRLGERVAALVVAREPLKRTELDELCRTHLARYKVPEVWGQVASLPTNQMHKVNRSGLAGMLTTASPLRED